MDTPSRAEQYNQHLANYIYDVAIYHGATDRLIKHIAATAVYLPHVKNPIAGSHSLHYRSLLVLLHKLGIRCHFNYYGN